MTTEAVEEVEAMEDTGPIRRLDRYKRKRAGDVVTALFEDAECVKRREVEEAVGKLEARGGLSDVQREAVEEMADAIVDQLLAPPAKSVWRAADWATIHTAHRLFGPHRTSDGKAHTTGASRPEVNDDD